jgi:dienelactone hydrolase
VAERQEKALLIPVDNVQLNGDLVLPAGAQGLVVFAHGSGSSRLSPRNRFVAAVLQRVGLATLLFDLLTQAEEVEDEVTARLRFDIGLLAARLVRVTDWLKTQPDIGDLRVGYFGASTGAAAALIAAAERPEVAMAVVSRGGRPDLADEYLPRVKAPTLLIVGGNDREVIVLNRSAHERLTAERKLVVVPGATHLFEEGGALEEVARLARDWFVNYLTGAGAAAGTEAKSG